MDSPPRTVGVACRAVEPALDDYMHERLPAAPRAALEAHAADCPSCARRLRVAADLSCREFVEFLDAYVAGELAPGRREAFEVHLDVCPDCRGYLASYRQTIELGRRAMTAAVGPRELPVPPELIRAILAARKRVT